MSNPWDRPPPPTQADQDLQVLYAAVGAALTHWETIESELSHIYALLIGKMWKAEAYDQYYEEGHTCQRRIITFANAGETYFQKAPNQKAEGEFSEIICAARGFADRRHEIAHGIARPVQWIWPLVEATMKPPAGPAFEFCLVPPHYQRSWFDPLKWNPEYIYTSREIHQIEHGFVEFLHRILHFRNDYLPDPRQSSP
jgi:hypothetical protein